MGFAINIELIFKNLLGLEQFLKEFQLICLGKFWPGKFWREIKRVIFRPHQIKLIARISTKLTHHYAYDPF
jgi:hypothetical protein